MAQLADYAEAGPVLSAMERDLVEVVRLAASLRAAQTKKAPICPDGFHWAESMESNRRRCGKCGHEWVVVSLPPSREPEIK